jgi:hypothetical protein
VPFLTSLPRSINYAFSKKNLGIIPILEKFRFAGFVQVFFEKDDKDNVPFGHFKNLFTVPGTPPGTDIIEDFPP